MHIRNPANIFLFSLCLLGVVLVTPVFAKEIDFGTVGTSSYKDLPVTYEYGIAQYGVCHDGTVVDAVHIEGKDAKDFQIVPGKDGLTGHILGPLSQVSAIIRFTPNPELHGAPEVAKLRVDTHGVDPRCHTEFTPCDLYGNKESPLRGDLVIYRNTKGENNHVAIVLEVKQGTDIITKVRSKWEGGAIYDHDPNETIGYGKNWTVWRRKRKRLDKADPNKPETRNALDVGVFDGRQVFKTDEGRNIHFGNSEELSSPTAETFPGLPSVKRFDLPDNPKRFDCRGYVFGGGNKVTINEKYLTFNQTNEILEDGYRQINAKDTSGIVH